MPWGKSRVAWCAEGGCDSSGAVSGSGRVIRGGRRDGSASYCRSAYARNYNTPSLRHRTIGFRIVRTLP